MAEDKPRAKDNQSSDDEANSGTDEETLLAIVLMADVILAKAIREQVSEIYVQPGVTDIEVHFVKNGRRRVDRCLPRKMVLLIARFKQLGGLDLKSNAPQSGSTTVNLRGKPYLLSIECSPGKFGQSVRIQWQPA